MRSPLSIAHHHVVHITCLNQFSASTLFSFYLFYYSMAEPRVLVLRFVLSHDSHHFRVDFKLSHRAFIKWHGVGGRTVSKTLHLDLNVIETFRPEIIIMQLGSNDLPDSGPSHVGSAIDDFVRLLHDTYGVKVVCVCQTIMRQGALVFNRKAKLLTKYLRVDLEPIPYPTRSSAKRARVTELIETHPGPGAQQQAEASTEQPLTAVNMQALSASDRKSVV